MRSRREMKVDRDGWPEVRAPQRLQVPIELLSLANVVRNAEKDSVVVVGVTVHVGVTR